MMMRIPNEPLSLNRWKSIVATSMLVCGCACFLLSTVMSMLLLKEKN